MNGSIMNVVCYDRGLLWTGLLWMWSVMNVVCYERVCYEQVSFERTPQGTILQWQWSPAETADRKSKNMLW